MEEGTTSQGIQVVIRTLTMQETGFFFRASKMECSPVDTLPLVQ